MKMEINFQKDISLLPMFSSSEYRILTPWFPTDSVGRLKLNLLKKAEIAHKSLYPKPTLP